MNQSTVTKLYIPTTLNIDLILWPTQLFVCSRVGSLLHASVIRYPQWPLQRCNNLWIRGLLQKLSILFSDAKNGGTEESLPELVTDQMFYCVVLPKRQNFLLQNAELFFSFTFNADGILSYFHFGWWPTCKWCYQWSLGKIAKRMPTEPKLK